MDIKEKAVSYHAAGFNCAQSVLSALGEYTGMDEKTSLAIGGGLGGGFRCGEICGALSGAVMAIGLAKPYNVEGDQEAKARIAELTKKCTARFKEQFENVRCEDVKGKRYTCNELIAFAAVLAKDIIENN